MKLKNFMKLGSIIIIVLFSLVMVGVALGQKPDSEETTLPEPTEEPASRLNVTGGVNAAAQPSYNMNYQGYLTDGSNNPLTGVYTLSFSLYVDSITTTVTWGAENHTNVQVTNGLFSVVLGSVTTLLPTVFEKMLYLELKVNNVAMPRQPLHTVPYAFGLVPGAVISGDPSGVIYSLKVVNNGGGLKTDTAIRASGTKYGIWAEETGSGGDVGIYSPDFVEALGYKSISPSYWWVSGINGIPSTSTSGLNITTSASGTAVVNSTTVGKKFLYLPVSMPSILLGQEVLAQSLTVYYYTSNAASGIVSTRMDKFIDAGTSETLITNTTTYAGLLSSSVYTLTTTGNYTLTNASGPLNVELGLNFNSTADTIYIGGIRLTLGHHD